MPMRHVAGEVDVECHVARNCKNAPAWTCCCSFLYERVEMNSLSGLLLTVKKRPPGFKQRASDAELFERRRPKIPLSIRLPLRPPAARRRRSRDSCCKRTNA